MGHLTPALEFITSLARQLHIPVFLSSPDPQTKVDYYIINVYPHYTATSQAFSDLIKFQQWDELAVLTERAESETNIDRCWQKRKTPMIFLRSSLSPRSSEITNGYETDESHRSTTSRTTGEKQLAATTRPAERDGHLQIFDRRSNGKCRRFLPKCTIVLPSLR